MLSEILAAMVGTVAFSLLFGVPTRCYPYCAFIGGAGWAVYSLCLLWVSSTTSVLAATVAVTVLSRVAAVREQCPSTVFVIPGIFPLVPGAGVYWTVYYVVTEQLGLAARTGYAALKVAVAIVLGIVFVFEVPQKVFGRLAGTESGTCPFP